ncbi:MAG: phosphopantothenoylcysteine decarboxylase [Planctomycetes bacterium]|nr:phosphopantothenoylcysteine decarboxylase [Planctomycetota bacterium]
MLIRQIPTDETSVPRKKHVRHLLSGGGRVICAAMRIIVTAGPTREYIDSVRYITNASSGRMGFAVATAAAAAGHEVLLLAGPVSLPVPKGLAVMPFQTVDDLKRALDEYFDSCDAMVMSAAVGDFRVEKPFEGKIPRSGGPVDVRLLPTEDLLAGLAVKKRPGQIVVAFAVEQGQPEQIERKARAEMRNKGADFVVVNTPAAMGTPASMACILGPEGPVLPWAVRNKEELANEIVELLGRDS